MPTKKHLDALRSGEAFPAEPDPPLFALDDPTDPLGHLADDGAPCLPDDES